MLAATIENATGHSKKIKNLKEEKKSRKPEDDTSECKQSQKALQNFGASFILFHSPKSRRKSKDRVCIDHRIPGLEYAKSIA